MKLKTENSAFFQNIHTLSPNNYGVVGSSAGVPGHVLAVLRMMSLIYTL